MSLLAAADSQSRDHAARAQPLRQRRRFATVGTVGAGFVLTLKILAALRYRVDSDEPQHLHVVWGWANGLLQYREVFDNHAPLFQMLCAPLFKLLGERADIIHPMRLAMIPLYGVCLWCVFRLGELLFSRRSGLWAAAFASLVPVFFWTSTEFRTDDLWAPLWLLSLVVLLSGTLQPRRSFYFGLLLGAAFATSMKTSLLAAVLALSAMVIGLIRAGVERQPFAWKRNARCAAALGAGLLVLPGAIAAYFALHGSLGDLYYCVVTHSVIPGMSMPDPLRAYGPWLLAALPLVLGAVFLMLLAATELAVSTGRALLLLFVFLYYTALINYWPDITAEDYLPVAPLLGVLATGLIFGSDGSREMRSWHGRARILAGVIVLALELRGVSRRSWLHRDRTAPQVQEIADVLRLTGPGDYVMDLKGEAIYRPRPYRYVFEPFTRERIRRRLLEADFPRRMVETHTALAFRSVSRKYEGPRGFLRQHYLPIRGPDGELLVPGFRLEGAGPEKIEVVIDGEYTLVSAQNDAAGSLDGTPFDAPRRLASGAHEFVRTSGSGPAAVYWSKASALGYSPFR